MSSNPTTETSSGTRSPESRRARMAPIAEISLKAKRAVKGTCPDSKRFVALNPTWGEGESPSNCAISLVEIRSLTKLASNAFDIRPTHLGVGTRCLPFDESDVAMAELKKML
jgi:hypothetical protein